MSVLTLLFLAVAATAAAAQTTPVPVVRSEGPSLRFDFPGMRVGVAEYDEGPTGTTVFYFPDGVKGAVDVRGGSPGTVNATALMDAYEAKMVQAVVFSGGSWYGLSAATGVANGIKDLKVAAGDPDFIAGVVAAIIYDVGGRRYSRVTPDDALGRAALQAARPGWFPLGARGAGRFAMQGYYYVRGKGADQFQAWPHSGQGGAFRSIGPTKVGVFTVVNALGTIVDRSGRVVRCRRNRSDGECPLIADQLRKFEPISGGVEQRSDGKTGNTTLTLVVTNQKLPFWALQRLAKQVHGSMSRAIQPFSTEEDGDVLYAVTTDEVENPALSPLDLGVVASEAAWDAVLASVPELPPAPARRTGGATAEELRRYPGSYWLGQSEIVVGNEAGSLTITLHGRGRIYVDADRVYRLIPAAGGLFVIDAAAGDVVRFEQSDDRVIGLTVNPGPWALSAVRRPAAAR